MEWNGMVYINVCTHPRMYVCTYDVCTYVQYAMVWYGPVGYGTVCMFLSCADMPVVTLVYTHF